MTRDDFRQWRKQMRLSQEGAAEVLDLSPSTIALYERGERREEDRRTVTIPRTVALACRALWHRLTPWGEP